MTPTPPRGGLLLLLALTGLNILNFADRYLLIAFSTSIVTELKLTNFEFGLLTGIVFIGIYAVMGLFAGSLADRVHRPRLIAMGLALWSGLTALTGFTRSFAGMAGARMFIGVGEACLTPASLSLLAERFAPARRAMASGFYYMGYPLGIGGSFVFAGIVGPHLGWRGGFMMLGILGVACSLLVLLIRDPHREARASAHAHGFADSFRGLGAELRGNPAFTLTLIACMLVTFTMGAGILELLWWVRERGYPNVEAQKTLGALFLVGGTLGAGFGGLGGDWAQRRWTGGRLKFLAAMYLVSTPLLVLYRVMPGHTPAFLALSLYGAMVTLLLFGPALSAVQEVVPAMHRGVAISTFTLCTSLVGGGFGNAAAGWLADELGRIGVAEPYTWTLLLMGIPGAIAIPVFWAAARCDARRNEGSALAQAA